MLDEKILGEAVPCRLREILAAQEPDEVHYSVYWAKHLRSFDPLAPMNWSGIGSGAFAGLVPRGSSLSFAARLEVWMSAMLNLSPLLLLGRSERRSMLTLCRRQSRAVDYGAWSHAHVLRTLNKLRLDASESICVIGDGLGTMAGLLACQTEREPRRIYSVNLTEVLLVEYVMLRRLGFNQEHFKLLSEPADPADLAAQPSPTFYLVPAQHQNLLNSKQVDLFINIDSFQEMSPRALGDYFSLIRKQRCVLYCCNLESKTLRDGTKNDFQSYPWGAGRYRLDGSPRWRKLQVRLLPTFGRHRAPVGIFRIPHLHRAISYGNNQH